MKMKAVFLFMFLFILLTACAAPRSASSAEPVATSSAVQIPDALKLAIGVLVLAVVMAGLQAVFETFGLELRGFGAGIAATVTAFAILQLQAVIDVIPVEYDQLISIALNVLVVILGGLGVLRVAGNPGRAAQVVARK